MTSPNLVRWSGPAAALGGMLWVVVFTLYASRSSSPGPPYGSFEGLGVPGLLSLLLIALGFVGLDLPSWRGQGHGRLGRVGFDVSLIGVFAIVVSGASWPVGMIGAYILMVGSVLVGLAALRAGTLPRWGATALVGGSLVFFLFNTDPARAWFALPYGAAWAAVGYLLWNGWSAPDQRSRRVR